MPIIAFHKVVNQEHCDKFDNIGKGPTTSSHVSLYESSMPHVLILKLCPRRAIVRASAFHLCDRGFDPIVTLLPTRVNRCQRTAKSYISYESGWSKFIF